MKKVKRAFSDELLDQPSETTVGRFLSKQYKNQRTYSSKSGFLA